MTIVKHPQSVFGHWKLKLFGFLAMTIIVVAMVVNLVIFTGIQIIHFFEPAPIHRILIPDEMIPAILHDVPEKQKESVLLGNRRTIIWLKNHEYIEVQKPVEVTQPPASVTIK